MMDKLNAGRIEVERWVIHEIPQAIHGDGDDGLRLSEAPSPYDKDVAAFFERKISESVGKSCHAIEPLPGAEEVPVVLADCFVENADLVAQSSILARRLFKIQTRAMSAGLLVIMKACYMTDHPMLAVVKLEKEFGARAEQEKDAQGKTTYSVEYLKDLFFTGHTRVFKIALFLCDEKGDLAGWMTDPQSRGQVAKFYLTDFLECQLVNDPKVATKKFHDAVEKFLNESVTDPITRAQYETAVLAELNGNSTEINITEFARKNLVGADRDRFKGFMLNEGVANSFLKDTAEIASKIRRMQYTFAKGVKVNVPIDSAGTVDLARMDDGLTELKVTDTLDKVNSRA